MCNDILGKRIKSKQDIKFHYFSITNSTENIYSIDKDQEFQITAVVCSEYEYKPIAIISDNNTKTIPISFNYDDWELLPDTY